MDICCRLPDGNNKVYLYHCYLIKILYKLLFQTIINKVIDKSRLKDLRKANPDRKIVFCSGCYDILQSGHAVFFNQCKQYGDLLVVGVGRDHIVTELKGPGRPVNSENNRVHLVAAFQDVDFAVLSDTELLPGKIDFKEVIENLRPDVFVLNQDDSGIKEKRLLCDRLGIRIQFVSREVPEILEPTSTTRIIDKINYAYRAPLRIDFAGESNLNYRGLQQKLLLPAGRFQLSFCVMSEEINSDQGVLMELRSYPDNKLLASSEPVLGNRSWSRIKQEFEAEQPVAAYVQLRRYPSEMFNNILSGRLWIDEVSIEPIKPDRLTKLSKATATGH